MGQKVHPHGFRLGYMYGWNSNWFAGHDYAHLLKEDLTVRSTIDRHAAGCRHLLSWR